MKSDKTPFPVNGIGNTAQPMTLPNNIFTEIKLFFLLFFDQVFIWMFQVGEGQMRSFWGQV